MSRVIVSEPRRPGKRTAEARRAWVIRYLLLWSRAGRSPRVTIRDALGMPMAYELAGHGLEYLAADLSRLRAMGLLQRHKGHGRAMVYWLADIPEATAWAKLQPEPELNNGVCDD